MHTKIGRYILSLFLVNQILLLLIVSAIYFFPSVVTRFSNSFNYVEIWPKNWLWSSFRFAVIKAVTTLRIEPSYLTFYLSRALSVFMTSGLFLSEIADLYVIGKPILHFFTVSLVRMLTELSESVSIFVQMRFN